MPSQAERFRQAVVKMYEENDVLAQVIQQAVQDLGENAKNLPEKPPAPGKLDIRKMLDAEFAFA